MLHLLSLFRVLRVSLSRSHFLHRTLPLLLAVLVLLAQTLALAHRTAHPHTGQRAGLTIATVVPGSALDLLFGHANGAACDDFDAALGLDLNPGQYTPGIVAAIYANAAPVAPLSSVVASRPPALFLARAPPHA